MFQLIVAVISIALIAALAISSIYYGGEAFQKSSEKSAVTALINQSQQISAALTLYQAEGNEPISGNAENYSQAVLNSLVGGKYLASIPVTKVAENEWDSGTNWQFYNGHSESDGQPYLAYLMTRDATSSFCQEIERQAPGRAKCAPRDTGSVYVYKLNQEPVSY